MATVTHRVATASTTNASSYASGSFTPAAGELLVAFVRAGATAAAGTMTDSQGLGWTKIGEAAFATSAHRVYCFIANNFAAASAMTVTFDCTGDAADGAVVFVSGISGMTRTGSLAVKQSKAAANQASGGTPEVIFDAACDTANPTLGCAGNSTNPATLTAPGSWTEQSDTGYNTPASGAEYVTRDSGFTGTTVTWGSTSGSAFGVFAVELDTSAIPGPTITAFETSDWTGTGTPKTITVTGALNGDKIVVLYGGDNGTGGTNVSDATVTTTGGSTGAWTEPEEGLAASSQCWASSSVADVTADGTVTVSLARTQSTGKEWGGMALLAHNHGGVGVHARSAPSATETVSLTGITQDSAVGLVAFDWDDLATVAFTPSGATEVQRSQDPNITIYAGYWLAQASGTRSYGIATSSTTNLHIIAIEILAATGGSFTGTASLSVTATTSAGGAAGGSADSAVTAGLTATGSANLAGTASLATTATLAAAGSVTAGANGSGTCVIAATLAAAGMVSQGASASITAALVAVGIATGAASRAITATLAAAGSVTAAGSGQGSLAVAASLAAAGSVSGSAVLPVTAPRSASGAATAGIALSVTAALTAAGSVTVTGSGSATRTVSVTLAAAGTVATTGAAALAAAAVATASGSTAVNGSAARTITAALVAVGVAHGAEVEAESTPTITTPTLSTTVVTAHIEQATVTARATSSSSVTD
jgi:hypothetical protein